MLLADAYVHALDPFAIRFGDGFGLRWYGLAYAAGFLVAWLMLRWLATHRRTPLRPDAAGDLVFVLIFGVLVGGRLGYVLFYDPSLLWTFDASSPPWWGLFAINRGGMASHGGILGVVIAAWWYARRHGAPLLHVWDLTALCAPPGLCFGRLANFVNGELPGRALPEAMQADPPAWSIQYPEELASVAVDQPERFAALRDQLAGVVSGASPEVFLGAVQQAIRDGNETVIDAVRPLLTAYHPSQLVQALTDGPLLLLAIVLAWWGPRKPGVAGSVWLMAYAVLRIASESIRQPDEGVALLLGLSRGQVLSVLMLSIGMTTLVWTMRRDAERYGGIVRCPAAARPAPDASA